jgi:hypothetical protein
MCLLVVALRYGALPDQLQSEREGGSESAGLANSHTIQSEDSQPGAAGTRDIQPRMNTDKHG